MHFVSVGRSSSIGDYLYYKVSTMLRNTGRKGTFSKCETGEQQRDISPEKETRGTIKTKWANEIRWFSRDDGRNSRMLSIQTREGQYAPIIFSLRIIVYAKGMVDALLTVL